MSYDNHSHNAFDREAQKHAKGMASSMMDTQSGEIFGGLMTVSPSLAMMIHPLVEEATGELSRHGAYWAENAGRAVARTMGCNPAMMESIAFGSKQAVRFGLPVWQDIFGLAGTAKKYFHRMNEVGKMVAPVMAANGGKLSLNSVYTSNNEVIANARKYRVTNKLKSDLGVNMVGFVGRVPNLMASYYAYQKDEAKIAERNAREAEENPLKALSKDATPEERSAARRASIEAKTAAAREERGRIKELADEYLSEARAAGEEMSSYEANRLAKQEIADQIKLEKEEAAKLKAEGHDLTLVEQLENKEKLIGRWGSLVAPAVSQLVKEKLVADSNEKNNQVLALDMIIELAKKLEEHPGTTEFFVNNNPVDLKAYIETIFQQHQKDSGRAEIGRKVEEDFTTACTAIAEAIQDKNLDPMALVNLVGNRGIVKNQGALIANKDEVHEQIVKQCEVLPFGGKKDPKQFFSKSTFTAGDIKTLLDSVHGEEKAFVVTLLPNEVLIDAGMPMKEIIDLRNQAKAKVADNMAAAIIDLAMMDEATLKDYKLTADQIKQLKDIAEEVQAAGPEALERLMGTADKPGIEKVVMDASGYWTKRIASQGKHIGDMAKDKKAEEEKVAKAEMDDEMPTSRRPHRAGRDEMLPPDIDERAEAAPRGHHHKPHRPLADDFGSDEEIAAGIDDIARTGMGHKKPGLGHKAHGLPTSDMLPESLQPVGSGHGIKGV